MSQSQSKCSRPNAINDYNNFNQFIIDAHFKVVQSGLPNYLGEKILLPSNFNFQFLTQQLADYHDKIVIEFLRYGFPIDHNGETGSHLVSRNHAGAREFPEQIKKLLEKEVRLKACIGPFNTPPHSHALSSVLLIQCQKRQQGPETNT